VLWKGLSRPGFKKTAPKLDYKNDGGDISGSAGNPNLKPYEATNFDVSLEFYGDDMTFVSVGLFRKDIKNAIYPKIYKTATFMGVTFNDDVETWENADDSTIDGLELNLQYGWENGIYFAGNITLTDGESTFSPTDDTSFTTPFRKLADEAANISIGYDKGPGMFDWLPIIEVTIWIGCLMKATTLIMFLSITLDSLMPICKLI